MHEDVNCSLLSGISACCTSSCQFESENLHEVPGRNFGQKPPISGFRS